MEKRGQFYLLAAVIIIALIIGFAAVSNYVIAAEDQTAYNLREELSIEAREVLEYGVLNRDNIDDYSEFLEHFTTAFDQRSEGEEIYFIFGSDAGISAYKYEGENIGSISFNTGVGQSGISILQRAKQDIQAVKDGEKIVVTIEEDVYEFDLNPGDNFYFIIKTEQGGNKNVIRSSPETKE